MFKTILMISGMILIAYATGHPQNKTAAQTSRSITVVTEPGSAVWINSVLFGRTGDDGRLKIRSVPAGNRTLIIRHDGSKEARKPLGPGAKGEIAVALTPTSDPAELAFQEAERMRSVDRQKAIAAFEKAVSLRPTYAEAYLGLARTLSESGDFERADKVIKTLKKIRPRYAEASAVEGRILKDVDEEAQAIATFKRAIAEGGGYQPEAYTGLGLLYKEKAENDGSGGSYDHEAANYTESAKYLAVAVKQLASAPDAAVVYQLLGLTYERQKRYDDAIRVYEEFLRLFPESAEATAVQSFIDQIKKQTAQPD